MNEEEQRGSWSVSPEVAVFVDAENVSWLGDEEIAALIQRVSEYGRVRHRRAYANWRQAAGNDVLARYTRFGFELVQVYLPVPKKNSADVALAVDVMDHLWRFPAIGCVVLVTGDSDFTPVFRRVRERSVECVGCGPRSVLSDVVMHHCTQFIFSDGLTRRDAPKAEVVERLKRVREVLAQVSAGLNQEVSPSLIKSRMLEVIPDLDERALGFASFVALLRAHSDLVRLAQNAHGTWLARPVGQAGGPDTVAVDDPVEPWRARLRAMSWPFVPQERLLGVAAAAAALELPLGRGVLKALLGEQRSDLGSPAEIGRALEVLFKARLMSKEGTVYRIPADLGPDEILDAVDRAMLARLCGVADREGRTVPPEVVAALLVGSSDPDRVAALWPGQAGCEE